MPNLAYILNPKVSDSGVLTGSATIPNAGVANLQAHSLPKTIFTSSTCYVEGDLGASYPLNSLSIGYINSISSGDTFRIRLRNSYPTTTSPVTDLSSTIWPSGSNLSTFAEVHRRFEFPQQVVRFWRVDFNCSQIVKLRRLFVGTRVEPVNTINAFDPDVIQSMGSVISLGGSESRREMGGPRRKIVVEWPALSKVEALGSILSTILERGMTRDYMLAVQSGDTDITSPMAYLYIGCGAFKSSFNTFTHNWSARLEMQEMSPIGMR